MKQVFFFAVALLLACSGWASEDKPLKASAVTGRWMLNGSVRAVQFNLKQDGTFEYRGYGSESKGRWNVEGARIRLRWTQVDSVPVDARKTTALYPVAAGALVIGRFEYRKNPAK